MVEQFENGRVVEVETRTFIAHDLIGMTLTTSQGPSPLYSLSVRLAEKLRDDLKLAIEHLHRENEKGRQAPS